jgi:acylphosphatase
MIEGSLALRLRVHGRVQGVWYRGWAVDQARALALDGWVRNRSDGTVEAVVRGPETAVREMVRRCRRGPPAARVTDVEEIAETDPIEAGFRQLPTA